MDGLGLLAEKRIIVRLGLVMTLLAPMCMRTSGTGTWPARRGVRHLSVCGRCIVNLSCSLPGFPLMRGGPNELDDPYTLHPAGKQFLLLRPACEEDASPELVLAAVPFAFCHQCEPEELS